MLTLEALKNVTPVNPPHDEGLTHAGGVVYRKAEGEPVKFLLVEAMSNRTEWVTPKRHIEPGEELRVTAVREVHEDSGNWARIMEHLGDAPLNNKEGSPIVRWYLMELDEEGMDWPKENRQRDWVTLDDAQKLAPFAETRAKTC